MGIPDYRWVTNCHRSTTFDMRIDFFRTGLDNLDSVCLARFAPCCRDQHEESTPRKSVWLPVAVLLIGDKHDFYFGQLTHPKEYCLQGIIQASWMGSGSANQWVPDLLPGSKGGFPLTHLGFDGVGPTFLRQDRAEGEKWKEDSKAAALGGRFRTRLLKSGGFCLVPRRPPVDFSFIP